MKFQATEYDECVLLADYLKGLMNKKKIKLFTHIPNETYTSSWSVKRKNKAMGVAKGVPDYLIVFKDKILFLEMKREKGGRLSSDQKTWIEELSKIGIRAETRHGFRDARMLIDSLC